MKLFLRGRVMPALLLSCSVFLTACGDSADNVVMMPVDPTDPVDPPAPTGTFAADIVFTQYGIPHIKADDWGSLGYGVGYTYARENYCTLMREYVYAAGESMRYLGEEGDMNSDLVMKLYNDDARIAKMISEQLSDYVVENLRGYAAGVSRYFRETGAANLAEGEEGCRGEAWVREVDLNDVVRLIHRTVLVGSAQPLAGFIVGAQPGEEVAQADVQTLNAAGTQPHPMEQLAASMTQESFDAALNMPTPESIGSNAYAVGEDASQTSSGILFGNPHFPWQGQQRFFMFHATLDDGEGEQYDMMGAALGGLPAPVIGFNKDVAWSHTVSTGQRFTFYELTLNPENRFEYLYDDEWREMTTQTVSIERMADGGGVETVEHTFYLTHFGPIVDLGGINALLAGWPNAAGTLVAYRDGNLENLRGLEQWINMGKATNLTEFKAALGDIGIPWVNTIAADRNGEAFYGDISVVPNVSVAQYANCVRGFLQEQVTAFGRLTMDGSDSACEWGNDADAPAGVFGYANLPKLETRSYGANANDSYWLSNPSELLEGFSPVIGNEQVTQSRRTRATFSQAEARIAGTDGLGAPGFNIDNIRQLLYNATNHAATLVLDDVLGVCAGLEDDPMAGVSLEQEACSVLSGWDGTHQIESVGGHVFYEMWRVLRSTDGLWSTPFDQADPVNTPRDLNVGDPLIVEAVENALSAATQTLSDAGIELDAPWGEVQFDEKNGVRYPIHGGSGDMMFSVITSGLVDGEGYSSIRHGNSYIQAVTWDDTECPDAFSILTYSQSTDPASAHYADATELYSDGGWIDMPMCQADQDAQEIGRMTITEEF
ncbi:MAG: penicillin acylase family protein [Halioglobus sp.]